MSQDQQPEINLSPKIEKWLSDTQKARRGKEMDFLCSLYLLET